MFRIVCDPSSGSAERLRITVQNYAAKPRLRTRKLSRVISVKHAQHSLMMDRKQSEIRRSDF